MNTKTILAIAAILLVLGAGYAVAGSSWNGMMEGYGTGNFWNGMISSLGHGYGMMGGYVDGNVNGMMGNSGMMNGSRHGNRMMDGNGNGMMGKGGMMADYGNQRNANGYGVNATPITIDDAKKAVEQYLTSTGNNDLQLAEVIQFDNHFYAGIKEKSTGKYAFELIVNKYSGALMPEMGPNMMWNTRNGHMNIGQTETKITEEQALKNAQDYLDSALPGTKVNDADTFYGYYTMEVLKDDKICGMLSVNSNTGAVWYHNWHGTFEKVLEVN